MKACNFKHDTGKTKIELDETEEHKIIYCTLKTVEGKYALECSGENNCFLFQIYKLLLALPKMSTIIDWNKTNTPR